MILLGGRKVVCERRVEKKEKRETNAQGKNKQDRKSVHADLSLSIISCMKDLRVQLFPLCLFLSLSLAVSVWPAAGSIQLLPSRIKGSIDFSIGFSSQLAVLLASSPGLKPTHCLLTQITLHGHARRC